MKSNKATNWFKENWEQEPQEDPAHNNNILKCFEGAMA